MILASFTWEKFYNKFSMVIIFMGFLFLMQCKYFGAIKTRLKIEDKHKSKIPEKTRHRKLNIGQTRC